METDIGALRRELVAMAGEDQRVRAELAADGSLFDGYHPRMEAVHRKNAARLEAVVGAAGWPGRSLVGEEASRAAWLILQHAIGQPDLMRRGLEWVREAAARGEVPAVEVAMLEDRIRAFEGRPQRYGTQLDWDDEGNLAPLTIEDHEGVDARRAAVGFAALGRDPPAEAGGGCARGRTPAGDVVHRAPAPVRGVAPVGGLAVVSGGEGSAAVP